LCKATEWRPVQSRRPGTANMIMNHNERVKSGGGYVECSPDGFNDLAACHLASGQLLEAATRRMKVEAM
jgi:hypothetical protein